MTALPAVFVRAPWGLVVVSGSDATSFLQSIVSQDLVPVAVGETVASLLLQPQGKLDVAFRATLRARGADGDVWWLDTEPQAAVRLVAGLGRFKIRVKVDIDDRTAESECASVVGVGALAVGDDCVAVPAAWGAVGGIDVVGPAAAVADAVAGSGLRVGTRDELEVLRIEAGIPAQGVDVDDATIPQEAFLERDAVSFTKGCFIGQELVCRIDSRGHVNRFLRQLDIPGTTVPPHGSEVHHDGTPVGKVTSAVAVPGEGRVVALAMVRREVEPPADVTVTVAATPLPAVIRQG